MNQPRVKDKTAPGTLQISGQDPLSLDVSIRIDDDPPADVWQILADTEDFQNKLRDTVRRGLAGRTWSEAHDRLREVGVTAVDELYADFCVALARGINTSGEVTKGFGSFRRLIDLTTDFGQPASRQSIVNGLYADAPWEDIAKGPLAVFGLRDESEPLPIIAIRIDSGFKDLRADQRRALCWLFTELTRGFDVRIVTGTITERYLRTEHRADLPSVSGPCTDTHYPGRLAELVERAAQELNPDGRPVAILRSVAAEPAKTLSYHALTSESQVSRPRIRQCVGKLEGLDLAETFNGSDGTTVDLLPAGNRLVEHLDEQIGRQRRLDECVSGTGHSLDHGRVTSPAWEAPPTAGRDGEADALDAADATARDWKHGAVDVQYLNRQEHAAAVAGAKADGIGLIDHPIERQNDGRQSGWSFDEAADRLVVSSQYANPMQWWVTVARALASAKTWNHVLTPDRLDGDHGDLAGLGTSSLRLLRDGRCLGWLADRDANGEGVAERLQQACADLLDLTRAFEQGDYADRNAFRGEILRFAQGLAGTMVHLLDLAGVTVVRELRLPHFRRDRHSDETFRADLAKTLAIGAAIQSRYGHFATYRQLFEDRPAKRESAIPPDVDAADPFGSLLGSFAVVGPGVSALEDDLQRAVRNPADIHEDAPEFALRVPIEDRTDTRSAYAQAVTALCRAKNLDPSRTATTLLRALTGSPYDVAAALADLAMERKAPGREIRLDEVRYALSLRSPDRILPDAKPTVSKVVHALLTATEPLSQKTLADRAEVSTRSIRRNRDFLSALDFLREVDGSLRFSLPFRNERDDREADTILPWYAIGSPDRDDLVTPIDVYFEIVADLFSDRGDAERLGDRDDAIGGVFFDVYTGGPNTSRLTAPDALPELRPWVPVIDALLDFEFEFSLDPSETTVAVIGTVPSNMQTTFTADKEPAG